MAHQEEFTGTPRFVTQEENEKVMKEASEVLDKDLKSLDALDAARSKFIDIRGVEAIVNGKYAPKCIVSTNNETEYITVSFQDLKFGTTTILMTKKSFSEFVMKIELFDDMVSGPTEKQLLKG